VIDVDATAVEEKKLQANPRGKKKGEKFRQAAHSCSYYVWIGLIGICTSHVKQAVVARLLHF